MRRQIVPALGMLVVFTIITGLLYPLLVTGIGQVLFNHQANGSLVEVDARVVGSELIGQTFTEPIYFHPRPTHLAFEEDPDTGEERAADLDSFDPRDSGGANLGANDPALHAMFEEFAAAFRETNNLPADAVIPVDAVTMSASGLDPMISIANAELQAPRVAQARGVPVDQVLDLVGEHTTQRALGFLGEKGVNVLTLNVALDTL